jgi:hypothetical protein
MMIFLVIILVSLVFVYVNTGREEKTSEEPVTTYATGELSPQELTKPEFTIKNLKFASMVDDNLNYQEIPATFNKGDKFWIYFEVNNLESGQSEGKYRTIYDEYIAVSGPGGEAIDELTGFLGTTTENAEEGKYYSFPIAHEIILGVDYKPGTYTLTIFIDDAINEKSATISAPFIVR